MFRVRIEALPGSVVPDSNRLLSCVNRFGDDGCKKALILGYCRYKYGKISRYSG
jgi:hypothetical protein